MGWTVEDYKRLGMKPPNELMAQATIAKPLVPKPQPQTTAQMYRDALARRLRDADAQ